MISYKKLLDLCEERGINSTTFKKNKLIGQAAWIAIRRGKDVRVSTIDKLCEFLDVQPGDILEFIPNETQSEQ